MFCSKCGKEVPDGTQFCPACGADLSLGKKVQDAAKGFFNSAEQQVGNAFNDVKQSFNGGSQYNNGPQYNGGAQYNGGPQYNGGAQYNGGPQYNGSGAQYNGGGRLQEDRNLLAYIVLSIITCGIYAYYFLYKMAHDVNIACDGDGNNTSGLVAFILLSFITCGIYAWIWYYNLGNRLAANAPRYGMTFQENGTTVLLWLIFGSFLCGIGQFVAMHILIKNSNSICAAYNRYHGL